MAKAGTSEPRGSREVEGPAPETGSAASHAQAAGALQAPSDAESGFRGAFNHAGIGMLLMEPSGSIVSCNDAFTRLLGYREDEMRGRQLVDIVHPDDRAQCPAAPAPEQLGQAAQIMEQRFLCRDGSVVWAHVTVTFSQDAFGRPAHLVGVVQDITVQRATREALRRSEESLRLVTDNSPAAIYLKDLDGRYLLINRRMREWFGIDPELGIGERADRWMYPRLAAEIARDERCVMGRREPLVLHYDFTRDDGTCQVLETIKFAIFDERGKPVGLGGIDTDVTERVRAEEALRDSEERFRQLVEHLDEGIVVWDVVAGVPIYANPACGSLWGVDPAALTREPRLARRNLHPEDRHLGSATLERALRGESSDIEYRLRQRDGAVRWVWERALPVRNAGGTVYRVIAILKDITSLKLAEQQRIGRMRAQRETLLREVHHRIKNALQGVAGLLRRHVQDTPALAPAVDHALREMDAVAVVYGMVGERGGERPVLQDMLQALVRSGTPGWSWRVSSGPQQRLHRYQVDSDETVPVALIVSELLTNAIKHGSEESSGEPGEVRLSELDDGARVEVRHRAAGLPAGFDFEAGVGIGTGLELVRALLPPRGAQLRFRWQEGCLTARLDLRPPVVVDYDFGEADAD